MNSPTRTAFRVTLLLACATTLTLAQEPTLVRLRDAVGDTIDLAERDSFRLFPNTTGFRHAVILAIPGPEFFAQVTLAGANITAPIYFRIMPTELERIRFLIDNREYMVGQVKSDPNAGLTLASFWKAIEDKPLRNIAGEPAEVQHIARVPADTTAAGEPQLQPVTEEHRYNCMLHGMTLGSCAGGLLGSWAGIKSFNYGVYGVSHPVYWTAACGMTALGSTAGYMMGDKLDRKTLPSAPLPDEGTSWRTCCCIGAGVPGLALGLSTFALAGLTMYGRGVGGIVNDPNHLTVIPAVLTGLCVTVEVVTIGYQVGRAIDRRNAEEAAAKRRALGPARDEHD